MPWQECSTMSLRQEFLGLANQPGSNFSQLYRRFGISRKTGHKWRTPSLTVGLLPRLLPQMVQQLRREAIILERTSRRC